MQNDVAHDQPSLILARAIIRNAYHQISLLPQQDPTIRVLKQDLVILAHDLSVEIESVEPELALPVPRVVKQIRIGERA